MTELVDPLLYRCPGELAVTALPVRRILIIGSCLSHLWVNARQRAMIDCEMDYFLLGAQEPPPPPHPASSYDFALVQVALRSVMPEYAYFRLRHDDLAGWEALFEDCVARLRQLLWAGLRSNREHGLASFVCNFILPQQNPFGRLLPRYDPRNLVHFVERLNQALAEELRTYHNVHLFDFDQVVATHGRRFFQDDAVWLSNHGAALGDFDSEYDTSRLEPAAPASALYECRRDEVITAGWQELLALHRTLHQADAVKLVLLDLDDTLWRGVLAELGDEPLPTVEGWPQGLWEALLFLRQRGVLLGIVSRNDEARILEKWRTVLDGRMELDDFAIRRINWRPKAENLAEILAAVNLTPRSVLFIDDNPVERAAAQAAFPELRVLGGNPLLWRRILLWSAETQVPAISAEAAARTGMVQAQVRREEQRARLSPAEFLASLQSRLSLDEIADPAHPRLPRALELLNRSNQFNTTGQRWTQPALAALLAGGGRLHVFDVADRFTAYGLVGVVLVQGGHIAQFVMSCRVAGLEVEQAVLALLLRRLAQQGFATATAAMVATALNRPCRELYAGAGFQPTEGGWQCPTDRPPPLPAHLTLSEPAMLRA